MRRNLIILLLLAGYFVACAHSSSHESAPIVTAPNATAPVTPEAKATVTHLGKLSTVLDDLYNYANTSPPSDGFKVKMVNGLTVARKEAAEAKAHAVESETRAVAKDNEAKAAQDALATADRTIEGQTNTINGQIDKIAGLQKTISDIHHSVTTWALGIGTFLSFSLVVLGVYLGIKGDLINGLAAGGSGAAGLTIGILFMTLADFFEAYKLPIGIGLCVVIAGALGVIGYFAYKRLHDAAVSAVKGVQANIAAGNLSLADAGPVFKAVETPLLGCIVNRNTPKKDPTNHVLSAMPVVGTVDNVQTAKTGGV